jgi:hypothetical protein
MMIGPPAAPDPDHDPDPDPEQQAAVTTIAAAAAAPRATLLRLVPDFMCHSSMSKRRCLEP